MRAYRLFLCSICLVLFAATGDLLAQDAPIKPSIRGIGTYHGLTPPLRTLPVISEERIREMEAEARKERNGDMKKRSYPYAATALPKGPDPVWQDEMGATRSVTGLIMNFNGQPSPYYPPDANGTAGPVYYMQTINTVYTIYDKASGAIMAGPTDMNELFSGVTGSSCNDGDPLILYDEQANRWLAVEFSICGSNDRMLVAVSQTSDPTGSWHKYSFDVADTPDYEKFGIWQDGYYMGTNNSFGNDIYVFERDQMLQGGTAQFVGFNNPWRPSTIDGFMCVPPIDNDGQAAPAGAPGLFITISDDAIAGGSDQLWIYELEADWANTANSTFTRSQQINVPAFDSNFGNSWDNIKQPGTGQELDAIPMVVMNRPQYRNFGSYETIVCCHTVDLDNTDHAGIRWYELRRTSGDWSIRQNGTFGPDQHSRWMGAIALNGMNEIGLAYSISSSTVYPGLRFCGQSAAAYDAASGEMDIVEEVIQTANYSQTGVNRWGDYADVSVDPENDKTFWFTSQYAGQGGARLTKIASFEFDAQPLVAAFSVSNAAPCAGSTVTFSDLSGGDPIHWKWTFEGGTPAGSTQQNPSVTYATAGLYDVRLIISNNFSNDTLLLEDYIQVVNAPGQADVPAGPQEVCQGAQDVAYKVNAVEYATVYDWFVSPPEAGTFTATDTTGYLDVAVSYSGEIQITVQPRNDCSAGGVSAALAATVHPGPEVFFLPEDGGYCEGQQGYELVLSGSQPGVSYELFLNGTSTGNIRPGNGSALSFGYLSALGEYTVLATNTDCTLPMSGSTTVYYLPGPEAAGTPVGPSETCNSQPGQYTTGGAANAAFYIWHIDPPSAGTFSGDGETVTVTWDPGFSGTATISVQGATECAQGQMSPAFNVTVILAPTPAVTGQTEPCTEQSNKVYTYTTELNLQNDYSWLVQGGQFVSGQGSNRALVKWTNPGSGRIILSESSPNGCTTIDTLEVQIFDCTGIGENQSGRLEIFPNPVEDVLTIRAEIKETGTATVFIYNNSGQQVIRQETKPDNGRIDVTIPTRSIKFGVYGIKLITEKGQILESKFLKSK